MSHRIALSVLGGAIAAVAMATLAAADPATQATGTGAPVAPSCREPGIQPPSPSNAHTATPEDYPPLSVALAEHGRVMIGMLVREDGTVGDVKVLQSSGFPRLDEASVDIATQRWRYSPAVKEGKPVECRLQAYVSWSLDNGAPAQLPINIPMTVVQIGPDYYTADMRSRHEQGVAVVFALLQEDGKIMSANIVNSSGYPDIDAASLKFVQNGWQFKAAEAGGRPIKTIVPIAFVWSLSPATPPASTPPIAPPSPQ
ncbi:MAG: energy transducer TonB [Rhizomicrobium sp.]|jgi:TonB family protein